MEMREIARLNHPSVGALQSRVNPVNLRSSRPGAESRLPKRYTTPTRWSHPASASSFDAEESADLNRHGIPATIWHRNQCLNSSNFVSFLWRNAVVHVVQERIVPDFIDTESRP